MATTHTMSGVYRKWDCQKRNPLTSTWKTTPKAVKDDGASAEGSKRAVPGASDGKGQVLMYCCIDSIHNFIFNSVNIAGW